MHHHCHPVLHHSQSKSSYHVPPQVLQAKARASIENLKLAASDGGQQIYSKLSHAALSGGAIVCKNRKEKVKLSAPA